METNAILNSNLDIIESLCKHNRTWTYQNSNDPELILRQVERMREIIAETNAKTTTKERISARIDSEIKRDFIDFCQDNSFSQSKAIEYALKYYMGSGQGDLNYKVS